MAELKAKSAAAGLLPLTIGGLTIAEAPQARMTGLSPFSGAIARASSELERAHGLTLPGPNRMTEADGAMALWFGQNRWLLIGPDPDAALGGCAALTDQSDAWTRVILSGTGAVDVLARLVPVDLRPAAFPPGSAIRTELRHMQAAVARPADGTLTVMTFRSMAGTLVHDLQVAAEAVAARRAQG